MVALLALAIAAFLALAASSALAASTHPYTGVSFGPDGAAGSESFAGVQGVAVDQPSGDVLVFDAGAGKIFKFDASGEPVNFSSSSTNVIEGVGGGGGGESEIAVAPPGAPGGTAGDIYAANNAAVKIYAASGTELGEITNGETCGVAVTPAGHVIVGTYPAKVTEYVPTANPAKNSDEAAPSKAPNLSEVCNVAADGLGNIYAANYSGSVIAKLAGIGATSKTLIEPGGPTLAVDPASNDLYVDRGGLIAQYDSESTLVSSFGASQLSGSHGVAANGSSGEIYADNGGGKIVIFGPPAIIPDVKTEAPSPLKATKATLKAVINADGIAVSECKFEYGTDASYGSTAPCEGAIPADQSDHPVTATLSGLTANTTYHFRVVATNANGTNEGEDQTFTTPQPAVTGAASAISSRKATLNGSVLPEGETVTSCIFEYELADESSKGTVPCEGAIPTDEGEHQVTAALTGLVPNNTSYSFRLVIERGGEVITGRGEYFSTEGGAISGPASAVTNATATLEGTVSPAGTAFTACSFEYGLTEVGPEEAYESSVPCAESPGEIGAGEGPVPVHADIAGLNRGSTYHYRVTATRSAVSIRGASRSFQTPGPPVIEAERIIQVGEDQATLGASLNPNGSPSSYSFEYGLDASYGHITPITPIGADFESATVAETLTGLTPGTTYHWRVVVENGIDTSAGVDRTFTTAVAPEDETGCPNQAFRTGPSAALPDCRAYELVSPATKSGEVYTPSQRGGTTKECPEECVPGGSLAGTRMPMQASPDGESIVYEGQPFSGDTASGPNQYRSGRSPGGWSTEGLSSNLFNQGESQGYKAASTDLSEEVVYQQGTALSPAAPTSGGKVYSNLYLRKGDGSFEPLVSSSPPNRTPGASPAAPFRIVFARANAGTGQDPNFAHLVFEANDSLTDAVPGIAPAAPEIPESTEPAFQNTCQYDTQNCDLYEWVAGKLSLVNVLPGNGSAVPGVIGSGCHGCENGHLYSGPNFDNAISADGSRVFWSDASGQVYVRIDGTETKEIHDPGKYITASENGSKVLLEDGCLYDVASEACEDLTEEEGGAHGGGFQGTLGGTPDLARVYFVDTAVLTPATDENANDEHAVEGQDNLYGWREGNHEFIGRLSELDKVVNSYRGTWSPYSEGRTAQVSPDGRFVAFTSYAPLTGYDNSLGGGGQCRESATASCREVFEYDSRSRHLDCLSCNPSGQPPSGPSNLSLIDHDSTEVFPAPSSLPTAGQGMVFFESEDALLPQDTNGAVQDVYEWKPDGVGGCGRSTGCLSMISDGSGSEPSFFLDSTPSGNNAFFVTRDKLLAEDTDDRLDLYDARIEGGIAEDNTPPCSGEECKGASTSPAPQVSPGSSTFSGSGNPKSKCKKTFVNKHGKCVRKKHHKRTHAHHKRAKHKHGGSR